MSAPVLQAREDFRAKARGRIHFLLRVGFRHSSKQISASG
jgi:hypothetical protein